ncbi:MAG TPA: ParB N-terminal domain-containing protein [Candidatus Eisenbacteria bacterium]|jgi:ParB family chromosome partitioning protein|nr:ParB N-terminal domain-containing protein [Candidatus Eisenbacteria bacterium]
MEQVTMQWQERRLGRTLLRTYRDTVNLFDVFPNDKQPRMGPKEDPELQRQIEANEGIFEPLLLEPHPDNRDKFRIIDGDRRWTNSRILVEVQKKDEYKLIPAEITDRTLTDEERLRVWIYIHRQRREWDTKEKEMVAYSLVNMVGRASAANILGSTVREVDKLVEIYDLSLKLTNLAEPGASITWAREIKNLNRKILTPTITDNIIRKINEQEITNSKDIRKLRLVLKDPIAKESFVSPGGTIDTALRIVAPAPAKRPTGLLGDIEQISEALQRYPWTTLATLKGNPEVLRKLEETEKLLKELRKALAR